MSKKLVEHRKSVMTEVVKQFRGKSLTGFEPKRVLRIVRFAGYNGESLDQVAVRLGITRSRLQGWLRKHDEIIRAYQKGIDSRGLEVEAALVKSAVGFEYKERAVRTYKGPEGAGSEETVTTKQVVPNVVAQKFFLERRNKKRWMNKELGNKNMSVQVVIDAVDEQL